MRPSQTADRGARTYRRRLARQRCGLPAAGGRSSALIGGFWLAAPSLAARQAQIWLTVPKSGDGGERPAEGHRYNAPASIILISQTNPWHTLSKMAAAL